MDTFPDSYVQRVRSVPGVRRADNLIVWFVTVALPSGAKESTLVYGLEHHRPCPARRSHGGVRLKPGAPTRGLRHAPTPRTR